MKVAAIVVAAGSGQRLGLAAPKAFVALGPYPILHYSLRTLARTGGVGQIVVTAPAGHCEEAGKIAQRAAPALAINVVEGGTTRQESVRIALQHSRADADVVVIHDAARPFASPELFTNCIEAAGRAGAAAACIPVADTLKQAAGDIVAETQRREGLFQAQTPQAFARGVLVAAHAGDDGAGNATDDAGLVERLGSCRVRIVAGSTLNFKITTAEDLRLARALLAGDPRLLSQFL